MNELQGPKLSGTSQHVDVGSPIKLFHIHQVLVPPSNVDATILEGVAVAPAMRQGLVNIPGIFCNTFKRKSLDDLQMLTVGDF